jgi:hypothetical protein
MIPFFKPVMVFVLRNHNRIDYEALMRAKREAFRRQHGNPYGNPFGNPYGNPFGNPYGNPYGSPNPTPPQEEKPKDPFEEFADADKGDSQKKGDNNDFFN